MIASHCPLARRDREQYEWEFFGTPKNASHFTPAWGWKGILH
jgi:hypothetical protein